MALQGAGGDRFLSFARTGGREKEKTRKKEKEKTEEKKGEAKEKEKEKRRGGGRHIFDPHN